MRFLFVATKYPTAAGDSYMTSELAEALTREGHQVDVLLLNWDAAIGRSTTLVRVGDDIRVLDVAPRALARFGSTVYRATKFILTSRHACQELAKHFHGEQYDALICWTPALTMSGLMGKLKAHGIRSRLLFIWDFFPFHHREIGRVPAGLPFLIAKRWEERLLRQFTTLICNFPGNIDYLLRHYRVDRDQHVTWTPLWSDISIPDTAPAETVRRRHKLPTDRPIAIFGGQITQGRGIEQMLGAAARAQNAGSSLLFLFVGDGRLAGMVKEQARVLDNVRHIPGLPRDEYLSLVPACDVGMVATVAGVTSFSFPTKTIDYLRAGIPVVAAVEHGSDYVAMLDEYGIGTAVPFGDEQRYFMELDRLSADPAMKAAIRARSLKCLEEQFDVRHTARLVLDVIGRDTAKRSQRQAAD